VAIVEWNDNLSVNVAEIDKQHKGLVKMINELADAMKEGRGKEIISDIIKGLVDYTIVHFKYEEKLFDKYGYEDTKAHKLEHQSFVKKVEEFKKAFESDDTITTTELMSFMCEWLRAHIKKTDKKYSSFLNEHGEY